MTAQGHLPATTVLIGYFGKWAGKFGVERSARNFSLLGRKRDDNYHKFAVEKRRQRGEAEE